jgi:hypothetical protein
LLIAKKKCYKAGAEHGKTGMGSRWGNAQKVIWITSGQFLKVIGKPLKNDPHR